MKDASFRCEEQVCGDGECTNGIIRCLNGRTSLLPADICSNATACSMGLTDQIDSKWCKNFVRPQTVQKIQLSNSLRISIYSSSFRTCAFLVLIKRIRT